MGPATRRSLRFEAVDQGLQNPRKSKLVGILLATVDHAACSKIIRIYQRDMLCRVEKRAKFTT